MIVRSRGQPVCQCTLSCRSRSAGLSRYRHRCTAKMHTLIRAPRYYATRTREGERWPKVVRCFRRGNRTGWRRSEHEIRFPTVSRHTVPWHIILYGRTTRSTIINEHRFDSNNRCSVNKVLDYFFIIPRGVLYMLSTYNVSILFSQKHVEVYNALAFRPVYSCELDSRVSQTLLVQVDKKTQL